MEEVQNGEAGGVNWTLEQSEARRKSKIGKLEVNCTRRVLDTGYNLKLKARIHMI